MDERFVKFLNIYDEFKEGTALRDVLNDAIRCYLHGIARPALMLSYIAFILGNNPEMIRKFWYEDFILFASSANVYVEMLRAKMIPKSEIKESLEMFLKHEYKRSAFYVDSPENFNVLKENGLYDIFIEEYLSKDFICNNPSEKCYKTDFYISLIHRGGISDKLIKVLSESIKGTFPYTLGNRLKGEIFKEEENKKQYFESIARLDLEDFLDLA